MINTKSRNVANRANGKMRRGWQVYLAARCCLAEAAGASFAGVICSIDLPLTWMKLSSRAASSAFTASFTRERATKFPKKVSSSAWLGGDDAVQIFREQRRERLLHR